MLDLDFQSLPHNDIIDKMRELHKRIAYIERTNMQASTLPQLRHMRQMLMLEMSSRIEGKKLDMYNKLWPTDSKIIGDEDL